MRLFAKCYNWYIKKYYLKHSHKNMIEFRKPHPHKKEENNKEDNQVTCYDYRKCGHYCTTCPSLTKCNNKKDSYKKKGNHTKGHGAYIAWEDEGECSSTSSLSLNDNELSHLCLMVHNNEKA